MSGRPQARKKESILALDKLIDSRIRVKCLGGREISGKLKGFDELVNLVLDECEEYLRGNFEYLLHACSIFVFFEYSNCTLFM